MYDPLSAADDQGQLSKEGLVTDWQTHDAGDVVTLTIRSGVKFHNGEPLTAADVKFSFETWKEQTGGSPSLTGAVMRGILKRVDVINDLQVQVYLHLISVRLVTPLDSWATVSSCQTSCLVRIPLVATRCAAPLWRDHRGPAVTMSTQHAVALPHRVGAYFTFQTPRQPVLFCLQVIPGLEVHPEPL